jgi:hypothetical protein
MRSETDADTANRWEREEREEREVLEALSKAASHLVKVIGPPLPREGRQKVAGIFASAAESRQARSRVTLSRGLNQKP